MVYLTHKTSRGQRYYYLVKSYKQEGTVGKVQEYLGQKEPSKRELEKLKRELTPDMEMKAIERMTKTSIEQYNPPFLNDEQTYSLERLRLLNRTLNRMEEPENRMMNELFHESVPINLHEEDLNSMNYSLENRSPFLGKNIINFSLGVDLNENFKFLKSKYFLKKTFSKDIPSILRNQKKHGFALPLSEFFETGKNLGDYVEKKSL